jgi:DNA-binding CsgD family transcriptional regulator
LPFSVLLALCDLARCDWLCQHSIDTRRLRTVVDKNLEPESGMTDDLDAAALQQEDNGRGAVYWGTPFESMCCNFPYWTGDHRSVHRGTDWYDSERSYFNSEIGSIIKGDHRFTVLMPLPPEGPVEHQVILFRVDGRDFSDREQLLLNLVRPHVAELFREQRRRRLTAGLTARQVQLVQLAAQGLTNRQIARRLDRSEGTVRTHMENIFQRLGVTSRAAAVARLSEARSP